MAIEIVKFLLKSVHVCNFMAWSSCVLADKLHPRIDTKILSKKVRLICWCFTVVVLVELSQVVMVEYSCVTVEMC